VKNSVFPWFFVAACLHMHGEVRHFGTARCRIHFRLMWCKNYRNWSRFAKFAAKRVLQLFVDHSVEASLVVLYILHSKQLFIRSFVLSFICSFRQRKQKPQNNSTYQSALTDAMRVRLTQDNPLMGTLKPQRATDHYTAIRWLVRWPLMDGLLHLVQRGGDWAGFGPAQSPPRYTKCNSPPINGQCTNFTLFYVAL